MIKDQTIDEALIEIMRTKKALGALRKARKAATETVRTESSTSITSRDYVHHSECIKEHSAVKRASLDLTRKLADLRAGK
jgi:hypothetical protein